MVAKLVHQSGIYFGNPDDLLPATPDNPDGHWEHRTFVDLSDEMLNELGAGWDCPPPFAVDWKHLPTLPRLRAKADALLAEFNGREPWGWKDPRATLTLPFWLELCPDLKVIICARNPLEVTVSLRRRGMSSYAFGLRLWQTYNRRLLECIAPARRLVTHYEAALSRPHEEIRRILDFLGASAPADVVEAASIGARDQLRHNRFTTRHLLGAQIAPDILQMYAELCSAADWREDVDPEPIVEGARQIELAATGSLSEDPQPPAPRVLDAAALDAEVLRRECDALRSAIAGRDESIRDLQQKLDSQNRLLAEDAALRSRADQLEAALREEQGRRHKLEAAARQEYEHLKPRLFDLIDDSVPRGGRVWIVSRGDDSLLRRNGRRTEHFPQTPAGLWAGSYPADDAEAIAQVEALRAKGGGYLVFPATATWWLDHYRRLRAHLQTRYRTIIEQDGTGVIFEVRELPWQRRLGSALATFQKRFGRDPAMLDWNSGLELAVVFPDATIFAPPEPAPTLPYIDRSVDIVVCPKASRVIHEARRVASSMIVTTSPIHARPSGRGRRSPRQLSVRVEWVDVR